MYFPLSLLLAFSSHAVVLFTFRVIQHLILVFILFPDCDQRKELLGCKSTSCCALSLTLTLFRVTVIKIVSCTCNFRLLLHYYYYYYQKYMKRTFRCILSTQSQSCCVLRSILSFIPATRNTKIYGLQFVSFSCSLMYIVAHFFIRDSNSYVCILSS